MSSARHVALVVVLVGGLALAGCTLQPQSSQYPDEGEVRDKLTSLQTVEADVQSETTGPTNQTTVRMHVVQDFENGGYRMTVTSGTARGTTMVSNGSQLWYYQPRLNTVRVLTDVPSGSNVNRTVEMIGTIYDRLDDDDADGSVGISPAPTVPRAAPDGTPSSQTMTLPIAGNLTVTDAGTESVDGRSTRVVELRAGDGGSLIENATYWIDREWHFPLRSRIGVQVGNETQVATTTYTNVSFNEPVDRSQFTFDPPSTATVVEGLNGSFRSYANRSAIAAATERPVPDPDVPEGYGFETGQLGPAGEGQTITMVYGDGSSTLTVTKLAGVESDLNDDAERIEVAGQEGRLVTPGTNRAVVWTCEGSTYSILGGADEATLRSVASSMVCD